MIFLIAHIGFGFLANKLYHNHIKTSVSTLENLTDQQEIDKFWEFRGKTSNIGLALCVLYSIFVLAPSIFYTIVVLFAIAL